MKKFIILGITVTVVMSTLLVSCKKNKADRIGTGPSNPSYPTTAHVIRNAVTDIDGNIYDAVQIGNQVWMAENLRTTRYSDGSDILSGAAPSYTTPLRYAPASNESNVSKYGYLYNWAAVMRGSSSSNNNPSGIQGVCPSGWHVPSADEWTELTEYVESHSEYWCDEVSTNIAKALASTDGWLEYGMEDDCLASYNPSANNATGFSGRPAGSYWNGYSYFNYAANFWSATKYSDSTAYGYDFQFDDPGVLLLDYYKDVGFSVRCIRN
jgi:uncharacterized protein (TIGR02145 family)